MEDIKILRQSKRNLWLEIWGVRLTALAAVLMGLINIISAVQPALQNRVAMINAFIPLEVRHGGRIVSALAGFALILLAGNLWRRKRIAWMVTVSLLSVSFISHLIKGLDFEEASVSIALLILLVLLRNSFHASSDRPSLKQGFIVLSVAFVFTLIYGSIGFFLLDQHFSVKFSFVDAIRQTVVMFTSLYNPGLEPISGFGKYFAFSIYVIGFSTLGFSLLMLIRPVLVRGFAKPEEYQRATEVVKRFGRTALARPVLFEDKSYFFTGDDSVIGYAAYGRGAISLGDPICPPERVSESIIAFRDYCRRNDWQPAFVSTLPDNLEDYIAAGFDSICLGYEAIVNLAAFSMEGKENRDIRYATNRLEKLGYTAVVHQSPLDSDLYARLHEISDAWLTSRHGGEMHFSDGWFNEKYIQSEPVMVIHAADGSPTAFANLVPEYQKNELTIDLMRHLPMVEYGTMEFMFVRLLQYAKENNYITFSLGLSAIVGVGEKPDDPRVEKALHTLSEFASRYFNFKGLHNFKEKFHPDWQPRYLIYPGAASLPQILSTLLQAHSGRNYLWKFLRKQ
ncbi:MAG: phosphatidylglycerol lysyltransferase domain-containing protein [Chloroflexi bacterium]|nr:phosphatidylglycerol lysyltransferase domain-containing protein [Chloroflexota bacterium]